MANQQTSLSQWLVSGATPPCKKAKVDSNTEDYHSLSELVSRSQIPPNPQHGSMSELKWLVSRNFQVEAVH